MKGLFPLFFFSSLDYVGTINFSHMKYVSRLNQWLDKAVSSAQEKLANNLKWTIAIIFMLLTAYSALIILAITNQK